MASPPGRPAPGAAGRVTEGRTATEVRRSRWEAASLHVPGDARQAGQRFGVGPLCETAGETKFATPIIQARRAGSGCRASTAWFGAGALHHGEAGVQWIT